MINLYPEPKEDSELEARLQKVELIPFRSFKEKIKLTKEYERYAKMEIIDDKYILLKWRREDGEK